MGSVAKTVRAALVACVVGIVGCEGTSSDGNAGSGGTSWGTGGSGGSAATGGVGASGGASGVGGSGGSAATGGAGGTGGVGVTGGTGGAPLPGDACALDAGRVQVTEVQLPIDAELNEDEAALRPLVISALPGGGSRLAFMGSDGALHVMTLDAQDQPTGDALTLPAHDFSDLYADAAGGVALLTRDAEGGGTLNCGEPTNLCGVPPNPPVPCFDMYMVRFDGTSESWATKLTDSSAALPPYSTSKTGPRVYMIWWYAHHGRIAYDGARYAGYYGSAVSVSEGGCINIHQGDRMQVVEANGTLATNAGFEWGCSHSGYERLLWDAEASEFLAVCKTDNANRIAIAPHYATIRPVDLAASNMSDLVKAAGTGYWVAASDAKTAGSDLAEVKLLRFDDGEATSELMLPCDASRNCRAPYLARFGADGMVALWESSTQGGDLGANDDARTLHAQARDRATGEAVGDAIVVPDVRGNRYHALRAFPDGSAALPVRGSAANRVKIVRVLPCEG